MAAQIATDPAHPAGAETPHPPTLRRHVSAEAVWLTVICLVDLLTTLWWVSQGQAGEGNPVLAYYLDKGHVPFILAKLFMFVPSLIIAEWYRPRNPVFIHRVLRWVVILYLTIYAVGVFGHYRNALGFYRVISGH
jgi:hypothetical protein